VEAGTTVFGNPAKLLVRHAKTAETANAVATTPAPRSDLH